MVRAHQLGDDSRELESPSLRGTGDEAREDRDGEFDTICVAF